MTAVDTPAAPVYRRSMATKKTELHRIPLHLWDGEGEKVLTLVNLPTAHLDALNVSTAAFRAKYGKRHGRATLIREAAMGVAGDKRRLLRIGKLGQEQDPPMSVGQVVAAVLDAAINAIDGKDDGDGKRPAC